ncbi:MAG: zf-HC2 domain-containing protein [Acidimicrobiia bacterium]|nr:zf-HC2 domain-containing protein [Acidimicrobiia bacterium]
MTNTQHEFNEALLSGYLDGELTQGDRQRVRLHLEGCVECSSVIDELRNLREATMNTEFQVPEDTQWDETPRGPVSRLLHNVGWLTYGLWFVGVVAYVLWQVNTDSESVQWEALLGFGLLLGFVLIVLSALVDRLQTRKNDPYRKVKK